MWPLLVSLMPCESVCACKSIGKKATAASRNAEQVRIFMSLLFKIGLPASGFGPHTSNLATRERLVPRKLGGSLESNFFLTAGREVIGRTPKVRAYVLESRTRNCF